MADVNFTAASIIKGANAIVESGIAGETITAGQAVYLKAADTRYWIADCTTSAATAAAAGYALNGAAAGQPLDVQTAGDMTCDNLSLAVAGAVYVLSAAGETAPHGDLAASDYITIMGAALSTTSLRLSVKSTGVQATA
jgi:hypothetical protein